MIDRAPPPPLGAPWRRVDCVEEPMSLTDKRTRERIRDLNDAFRTTFTGGLIVTTAGVDTLPLEVKMPVMGRVWNSHEPAEIDELSMQCELDDQFEQLQRVRQALEFDAAPIASRPSYDE